ncbi:MAG: cytotoxin [Clostridia bacterium]|nr:cytotoxin [Clostridia bacterium]
MLKITYTDRFQKHYKTLTDNEKKQFRSKLQIFVENPLHPSLRVKRLQGTDDLFEFSVNMDIRVIWFYEGDALIALVDIGHHGILRNY